MKSPCARFVPSANVVVTVNFCEHELGQSVYSPLLSKTGDETHLWEQHFHNAGTGDGSNDLRNDYHSSARICQATDQRQGQSHSWVEQAAADAEEHPRADRKTESERKRDVQQCADGWRGRIGTRQSFSFVRDLRTGEGEEEEKECAEKFANGL
jgi:hypothetical protein